MSDHRQFAAQLPGNQTPDIVGALPDDPDEAVTEFLKRLTQVRGKYGRQQLLKLGLEGWEGFGANLDQLDSMFSDHRRAETKND